MKDFHELEVYACVDAFPNYLVTNKGRVLSLKDNHGKRRMKELKQCKNKKTGYIQVTLHKHGRHTKNVHRLVAQAFIPKTENKIEINHIDENKSNNCVSNLEWVTHKENINHANYKGSNHPLSKSIIGFKINGCDIKYYKFISDCKKDNFNAGHIVECCRNKRKSHKGYEWYYTDEFFNKNK